MRKIKLFVAASLDNFVSRTNGEVDWLFTDQDYGYQEFYQQIDVLLMGRKTYQQVLTFGNYPYPDKMNYIFTRNPTLKAVEPIQFVTEDCNGFIKNLREKPGKDIWLVGGAELIHYCLQHNLIDELILSVHPILLGEGIPLFPVSKKEHQLKLLNFKTFSTGLAQIHYQMQNELS